MASKSESQITDDEVAWSYRMILGREPESPDVVAVHRRLGTIDALREVLLASDEFKLKRKLIEFDEKWVCVDVHGDRTMWVDLHDKYVSFGCLLNDYEGQETRFIRQIVKSGQSALDIGANVGWHVLGLANAVGPSGYIAAMEPRNPTFRYLSRTVHDNNLTTRVDLFNCGLWHKPATLRLTWGAGTVNPGGSYVAANDVVEGGWQDIELRRLDDIKLRRIDFIKIDIEGAELNAFKGAQALLKRDAPLVLSELHPAQLRKVSGCSASDYISFMARFGYQCRILEENGLSDPIVDFPANPNREIVNVIFHAGHHQPEFT